MITQAPLRGVATISFYAADHEAAKNWYTSMGAQAYEPIPERGPGFVAASVVDPFGDVLGIMTNSHYEAIWHTMRGD